MANYKDIKYNFSTSSNATGLGGSWKLIKTQTVSSSVAAVDFIHGTSNVVLDDTYEMYLLTMVMVHPSEQKPELLWAPGDGDFTETKLSTNWITRANATEEGGSTLQVVVGYNDGNHSTQRTAGERIGNNVGNENEKSGSGCLYMFGFGETDQWKSAMGDFVADAHGANDEMESLHFGCNIQQTGAIDRFRLSFTGGTIDSGIFSLYGLTES